MTKDERMHRRQLEKAALISNMDLNELTSSQYVKLQADLYEFLSAAGLRGLRAPLMNIRPDDIRDQVLVPTHYVPEMLRALRDQLIDIATVAAVGKDGDVALGPLIQPTNKPYSGFDLETTAPVTLQIRSGSRSEPFSFIFNMEPTPDGAKWALLYHLGHSNLSPDRVRFCPREGCDNVFVLGSHARTDRMRYCSIRCSGLVAAKKYRQKKEEEEKKKQKGRRKEQVAIPARKKRGDYEADQKKNR
jgi:hypothetical protein